MLTLTRDEARKAVDGKLPGFTVADKKWLQREKGVDHYWAVIREESTQKFYKTYFCRGFRMSGNSGWDVHPFDSKDPEFEEVEQRPVVSQQWLTTE